MSYDVVSTQVSNVISDGRSPHQLHQIHFGDTLLVVTHALPSLRAVKVKILTTTNHLGSAYTWAPDHVCYPSPCVCLGGLGHAALCAVMMLGMDYPLVIRSVALISDVSIRRQQRTSCGGRWKCPDTVHPATPMSGGSSGHVHHIYVG